jgi:DNA end-binding protein Ku
MEERGRAGIATFVLRGKESLVAILAEKGLLRAETLRFHDEIRAPDEVGLPEAEKAEARRVRSIEKAIAKLEADELDREWLADSRRPRLLELARRKLESGEDVVAAPPETEPEEAGGGEVIDLMQALKRSLRAGSSRRGPKARPSRPRAKAKSTPKTRSSGARRTAASKRKAR